MNNNFANVKIYKCFTKSGTIFFTDCNATLKIGSDFCFKHVNPLGSDIVKFYPKDIVICEQILTLN